MDKILLIPPIAFGLILLLIVIQGFFMKKFAPQVPDVAGSGKKKPYACGEDTYDHKVRPDYAQFFSFAFFFTIMHVVALIVATVPAGAVFSSMLAAIYVAGAALGLFILFRR